MSAQSATTYEPVSLNRTMVALSISGIAMLVLYLIGVRSKDVPDIVWFLKVVAIQIPIYLAAIWLSLHTRDSRAVLLAGLTFAVLFRLSIIFSPPYLSDDIYRYIWDGRVQFAHINPYRYIPADEALASLRDEKIYPHINRRDYAQTIYPPVAEAVYLLTTRISESVTWMKLTMVGFEAIAVWAIVQLLASFGFARQRVLIYAWHPLAVWEFAGSGHVDAIAIAFVALALLARRKNLESATGVLLACATLVKIFPVILFPTLFKRWNWKMPLAFVATTVIAYLPYLSVGPARVLGFLPGYASERGMVSGEQYFLLTAARQLFHTSVPTVVYLIFALLVLGTVSIWSMRSQQSSGIEYLRNGLIIASGFLLLLAPHFSWYFTLLIPFLCFVPSIPFFYLTFASFLLYLTWLNDAPPQVLLLKGLIFVPFLIMGLMAIWLRE
jgi:hypothetical protein